MNDTASVLRVLAETFKQASKDRHSAAAQPHISSEGRARFEGMANAYSAARAMVLDTLFDYDPEAYADEFEQQEAVPA